MKLLLDQDISFRLVKAIESYFPGTIHISQVALINASNLVIRKYAIDNSFTIVTYDDDFTNFNLLYGPPPRIIWIRKGNLSNQELADLLLTKKQEIMSFLTEEITNEPGILEIF
jgi:predicted nuclease of predicted toxin-antitoxin system